MGSRAGFHPELRGDVEELRVEQRGFRLCRRCGPERCACRRFGQPRAQISIPSSWSQSEPTPSLSHPSLPLLAAPLAGVHVTSPDLLPVLAAGQLLRLEPLLHRHESLLNAAAAVLGAVRPAGPRPHPAPCGGREGGGDGQTPVQTRR